MMSSSIMAHPAVVGRGGAGVDTPWVPSIAFLPYLTMQRTQDPGFFFKKLYFWLCRVFVAAWAFL